jgi:hypothetical protein
MKIIKERDLKGNETGKIGYYSAVDGKNLAIYNPERPDEQLSNGRVKKGCKAYIRFNTDRLTLEWDKSILDRAKPQYKDEIAEILELYKDVAISEFSFV